MNEVQKDAYVLKLEKTIDELAQFIQDLNVLIQTKPEFSSLFAIWKPISVALIQIARLQSKDDKLALIFVSRYLYEQTVQCLWMLKSENLSELEIRHTAILKQAIKARIDYLDQKKSLEDVIVQPGIEPFIKLLCEELTKDAAEKDKERKENLEINAKLDQNLKDKNLIPSNGTPPVANMASVALMCNDEKHNMALHINLYKILSMVSHPSIPFSAAAEPKDFLEQYEGGTAVQVGKILTIKMVQYACDYTNEFIHKNS